MTASWRRWSRTTASTTTASCEPRLHCLMSGRACWEREERHCSCCVVYVSRRRATARVQAAQRQERDHRAAQGEGPALQHHRQRPRPAAALQRARDGWQVRAGGVSWKLQARFVELASL